MIFLRHPKPEVAAGVCYGRLELGIGPEGEAEIERALEATAIEVAAALGTALVLGIAGGWPGLLALVLAMAVTGGFLLYMVRRVGGYTGDGLGAVAQLGEITVMVVLAGAWA